MQAFQLIEPQKPAELRGVPVRLELGPRDLDGGVVTLARRLGDQGKEQIPLDRAAELVPESVEPAYSLGLAYRQLGQDDEARRWHDLTEHVRRRGRGRPPLSS